MADTKFWHPFADMGAVRGGEFVIERGEDVWVFDSEGNRYLDACASLWYANIGHGRPEIAAAVAEQFAKIEAYSAFGDFACPPTLELTEMLADRAPMPSRVFLTSGGGDSIDVAAKLARRYWYELGEPERTVFVSRTQGYHGTHGYGTAIGGIGVNRLGYGQQVESEQVAHDSVEALEETLNRVGAERVAAFFIEPVIGAGGVHPPVPRYIEGVAALCKRNGVLLVVDSVICGFGRLGTWFGIERWDVEPDMITFAKGVTNGAAPMGGVVVRDTIHDAFMSGPEHVVELTHGYTYSAHPLACAAGLATLDIYRDEKLFEHARAIEPKFADAVMSLRGEPNVLDIRTVGLTAGIDLASRPDLPGKRGFDGLNSAFHDNDLMLRVAGDTLALTPPLIVSEDQIGEIVEKVAKVIRAVA